VRLSFCLSFCLRYRQNLIESCTLINKIMSCDLCPALVVTTSKIDPEYGYELQMCSSCSIKLEKKDPHTLRMWRSYVNSCRTQHVSKALSATLTDVQGLLFSGCEKCERCKKFTVEHQFNYDGKNQADVYKCKNCHHQWSDYQKA
jgi:DNA-directed RNA polymerase subunit M/transcription elongation factor TFIIS